MRHAQEQAQEEEKAHLDEARRMLAELEANASARAHQADGNAALHDDEPAHQAPQQAPPAHQDVDPPAHQDVDPLAQPAPQQAPPAPAHHAPQQAPPAQQYWYPPAPAQHDPPAVAANVSDDEDEAWGSLSGNDAALGTAARGHGRPR